MSYSWPEMDCHYDECLHAIGRTIIIWNEIEGIYDNIIAYTSAGGRSYQFFAEELNNSQKINLIKHTIERRPDNYGKILAPLLTFLRYSQICSGNRNFLSHCVTMHDADSLFLAKSMTGKVGKWNVIEPSTAYLRNLCDEMKQVSLFGDSLCKILINSGTSDAMWVGFAYSDIPEEPSQPESWDKHPSRSIVQTLPLQPQSSPQ